MIKDENVSQLEAIGIIVLNKTGNIGGGWVVKVIEENEEYDDDENTYKIYSIENPNFNSISYWKVDGWHDSYEGELHWDHQSVHEVKPIQMPTTTFIKK